MKAWQNKLAQKLFSLFLAISFTISLHAQKTKSGNPVFPGWYADPEGIIFNNQYWIYPTYSAKYDKQVFFDASPHLILLTGKNIAGCLIRPVLNGPGVPCGHPRLSKRKDNIICFLGQMISRVMMNMAALALLLPTIRRSL